MGRLPVLSYKRRRCSTIRRRVLVLIMLLMMVMVMVGPYSCDASSRMIINGDHQVFNTKPKSSDHDHQVVSGHFLDFLPKGIPIPSSGPSRKHNDIGLQSYSTSSSSSSSP